MREESDKIGDLVGVSKTIMTVVDVSAQYPAAARPSSDPVPRAKTLYLEPAPVPEPSNSPPQKKKNSMTGLVKVWARF